MAPAAVSEVCVNWCGRSFKLYIFISMILLVVRARRLSFSWLNLRLMATASTGVINSGLEKKLQVIDARCHALRGMLEESMSSMGSRQIQETHQELKRIAPISEKWSILTSVKSELQGVQSLIVESAAADAELHRLAREEEAVLKQKMQAAEEDLLASLLPSAQDHDRGAIVEIRPGTGGDEASLFAADLSHLYRCYADYHEWQCEVMEASTNDQGGFKLGSFAISGPGAYGRLKYEGGTHR